MAEKERLKENDQQENLSEDARQKKLARLQELESQLKQRELESPIIPQVTIPPNNSKMANPLPQALDQQVSRTITDPILNSTTSTSSSTKIVSPGITFLQTPSQVAELEYLVKTCQKNQQLKAALLNCETLVKIATTQNNSELREKYLPLYQSLRLIRKFHQEQQVKEQKEIKRQTSILQNLIEIDPDVASELEELPIEELIGDITTDLTQIQMIADRVLEEHRVKISQEIPSSTVCSTMSGKAFQLEHQIQIRSVIFQKKADQPVFTQFIAENTIENPFSGDPIESGIIEDIIPYNYKITEVQINDELTHLIPDKSLTREGLQLTWHVPPVPPQTPIRFRYILQPRVSRTIVVPLQNEVKVIKTHSTLQHELYEGIFDTELKFVNQYNQALNGVVLEDHIPPIYEYEVVEHNQGQFKSQKEAKSNEVRWKLYNMSNKQESAHDYRLMEPVVLEQLKMEAEKQLKKRT